MPVSRYLPAPLVFIAAAAILALEEPIESLLQPDGTLRKIEVKVNRPGVEVHTRSSYYAPEPEKTKKPDAKNATSPEAAALAKAMSGILPLTGMPMRVSAAPFAVPGQRLSTVAIVLGIRQPIPAAAANGRVTETTELLTSAFTPEGSARGAQRHTARVVHILEENAANVRAGGRVDQRPRIQALAEGEHLHEQTTVARERFTALRATVFVNIDVLVLQDSGLETDDETAADIELADAGAADADTRAARADGHAAPCVGERDRPVGLQHDAHDVTAASRPEVREQTVRASLIHVDGIQVAPVSAVVRRIEKCP